MSYTESGIIIALVFVLYENCKMAIAISSFRADSVSVPGVAFKWVYMVAPGLLGWDWYLNGLKSLDQLG